jgi:metabolite-proton symporter
MLSPAERRAKIGAVVRVSSGNFVEMYDFMVYGYYARYIGQTFFPSENPFASLMLALVTFGAGYLMRPLGALVLGAYIDRHGRRAGLLLTLSLMAIGTLTIALTPGYAVIGVAAPLIVVAGRLLQGLSAGVELGGVSVYLAEIATPGNRGFYCAWQSASQQVAVMFAALLGVGLTFFVPPEGMSAWGWRVPLIIGCLIIPLIFWLRRSLEETEVFARRRTSHTPGQLLAMVAKNWRAVGVGMMMSVFTTTSFYLITAYTPTFGREALHLSPTAAMLVTLAVGASNFIWLPIGGHLSDRYGRRKLLFAIPILAIVTTYPVLQWLVVEPSFGKLLAAELWISMFFGLYNGAMIPRLAEIVPPQVRTAAFALAFSLATAIFGGFTPAVATYLIEATGNKAAPGLWLSLAAVISLTGVFLSNRMGVGVHDSFEVEPAAVT